MVGLVDGRHAVEIFNVADVAVLVVYGEIPDAERCEILKEMRALAWLYAVSRQCRFGNHACG